VPMTEGIPTQLTPQGEPSGASRGGPRDVVTVRLPASPAYLAVLRTTTASLAARLDFTLDEIEDLRIAVDEACGLLLVGVEPGSELTTSFEMTHDEIRVAVTALSTHGKPPSRDSFAWTVLSALAGQVDTWAEDDGRQTILLTKHRGREVNA